MNAINDAVTHNGRQYSLADLAHHMDDAQREEVHSAADSDTPAGFWAEFARRFPGDADRLTGMTRPVETTVSLLDFANGCKWPCLFMAGVGCPAGDTVPLGDEVDFADDRDLYDLEGTVDDDGHWQWNGEGNPSDHRCNTIYRLEAYSDKKTWHRLVNDAE